MRRRSLTPKNLQSYTHHAYHVGFQAFFLVIQSHLHIFALTAPSPAQPPTGLAPLSLPNLPLNIISAFNLTSPVRVDQLHDPYLFSVPDSTILIEFGGYGNRLNYMDASKAVWNKRGSKPLLITAMLGPQWVWPRGHICMIV
ncbi:hypothetical protein ABVK25_004636 [Lepraria finkii]|uniref:Uncharacterized protein n=1 Tax=Lepraria finkii TaxID=1340010 RepID=A0ABR4BH80_9LECA